MGWDTVTVLTKKKEKTKTPQSTLAKDGQLKDIENPETPKNLSREIGHHIQQAREKIGLTRKELAMKINEKETIITKYEGGKIVPTTLVIKKLETILKIKINV